jgi:hypothetical protein
LFNISGATEQIKLHFTVPNKRTQLGVISHNISSSYKDLLCFVGQEGRKTAEFFIARVFFFP